MLHKQLLIKSVSDRAKKSKSFDELNVPKNKLYHESNVLKSHFTANYDYKTLNKIGALDKNTNIEIIEMKHLEDEHKKVSEIEKLIQEASPLKAWTSSKYTFKRALLHRNIHDIILENEQEKTVTIIFLPISTSKKKILCGIQQFKKNFVYSNNIKNFYTSRILFQKTMTRIEYNKWIDETNTKYQFESDINARKIIFNEVQKDLEENNYSILKDTDLIEFNVEFFTKELPLIKFKFTDFVE